MRFRNLFAACLLSVSLGIAAGTLHAQGIITGSVTGLVQDSTGAVIPGATVTAISKDEKITYTAKANNSGEFTFSNLPVGIYTVSIKMTGFGDLNLDNVLVETGKATGLGVEKLTTGSAVETVEVSTGRNLLETTQAQVTTTFDSEMVQDLPTGGGLDQLALLVPGVVGTHSENFSNTNGVGISSNGQRGRSNNFEIDGQANNDNSVAGSQVFFDNQDAVAEIQIITNNFSAQYGRNMGSVVNYVTKSGTNSIHGTAFEYYTGSWLSALTQGQKSAYDGYCQGHDPIGTVYGPGGSYGGCSQYPYVPRFTNNTFGGTLGFPVLKDKLFGFGSALFTRDLNGKNVSTSGSRVFPTPLGLQQLAAAFPGNPAVTSLTNQGTYGATGGNVFPVASTITNRTICAYNGSTCPTGTGVPIQFAKVERDYNPSNYDEEVLGRMDYQATPKDRFYIRYLYQNAPTNFAGGTVSSGAYYNVSGIAHSVGSDWTHTFGPRWVNQVRYSFQQSTFDFDHGGFPTCTVNNLSSCPSTITLSSPYQSYGLASNIPQGRTVKVTQVQDNATWNIGRHSVTFGGEFDYQNSPNVFLPYINGGFSFSSINQMLAGTPSTVTLASGASPHLHFTEPDAAAYIQDDWKVTPALTMNLGLRYEFFGQSLNILHNVSLAAQTGANPQWNTSLPLSQTTFPYTAPFKKGFEPRIGFAYNPEAMKKLVVRGGFAINFDPAFYNIALNSYSAAPVVNQTTLNSPCNGTTITCLPAAGTFNSAVHALDDPLNPSNGDPGAKNQTKVLPNFHNPYAESYTLGVQYEVLKSATIEVRYSGNHTVGNFQTFNGNPTVGPQTLTNLSGGVTTSYQGVSIFNGSLINPNVPAVYQSGFALVPAMATYFPAIAGSYCTSSKLTTAPTATLGDLGRENCEQSNVRVRANTAFSNYNSLQTSINTRNLYGFTGSAAWTFGREIDNTSEVFSGNSGLPFAAQNPYNINTAERGIGATSFKNVTSVGLTYSLPFGKNSSHLVTRLAGGLRLNTLYTFNSGQPYTPGQDYYSNIGYYYLNGVLNSAPSAAQSTLVARGQAMFSLCDYNFNVAFAANPDACHPFVGNPAAPAGTVGFNTGSGYIDANGNPIQRNQARYITNNVYEALAQGTPFGNVPRNSALGSTYNNVNFGAFKDFHVTERYDLQIQATLFNALNRGYYGQPDQIIDDANYNYYGAGTFQNFSSSGGSAFGPTTGSATGSRNIQLGAKILF